MGLCRLDPSPNGLHAVNMSACDPDGTIGSPGQPAYDPRVNPDGSHFVYVPDNSRKSPGMWRLVFDPNTEAVSNPVLLVPGAGLAGVRADATAIGPDGNLYVGSLADGNIRRISDPAGDPRKQVVDIIAMTTDGRGINGTMAFVGGDLYLPENRGLSVVRDAASCAPFSCFAELIPLDGVTFVQSVASNSSNTIYVATAAGAGPATIYRYTAGTGAQEVFETQGAIPLGAGATEDCAVTCEHPIDAWLTPGGVTGLHFVLGMDVDPSGTLFLVDDPLVGARFSVAP
jgi:hypothetical protein